MDQKTKVIVSKLTEKQAKVLAIHRQHQKGLSNWRLEILAGSHNSTWRTRVSELVKLGLLVDSHRTERIANSDDPNSERIIFICREFLDPYLNEPLPVSTQVVPAISLPILEKGEKPSPGFIGYSYDGHFIHYCACGKDAGFGIGYFPRKGEIGKWYCWEHRSK